MNVGRALCSNSPNSAPVVHNFKVPVNLEFDRYLQSEIQQAGYTGTIESKSVSNMILSPLFAVGAVLLAVRLIAEMDGSGPRLRSLATGR